MSLREKMPGTAELIDALRDSGLVDNAHLKRVVDSGQAFFSEGAESWGDRAAHEARDAKEAAHHAKCEAERITPAIKWAEVRKEIAERNGLVDPSRFGRRKS